MPRRRRRPRSRGGSEQGVAPGTPLSYLAARVFGDNPRLPLAAGKALLKIEPAVNTKHYTSKKGEKTAISGVVGAALVVYDPEEELDFDDNGRLRLRVLSAAELRRFGWRLIEYAETLEMLNALGVDFEELRSIWFGGASGGARRSSRDSGADAEAEEDESEEEEELEEEEVA